MCVRHKRERIQRDSKQNNKEGRRMRRRWIKKVNNKEAQKNKRQFRSKKKLNIRKNLSGETARNGINEKERCEEQRWENGRPYDIARY